MSRDFDDSVVNDGLKAFIAQRKRAECEYTEAESYGNSDAAFAAAVDMAEIDSKMQNLINLHQRTAPKPQEEPEEKTQAEIDAKPLKDWKDWRDAARICGVSEDEYLKQYHKAKKMGRIGEHDRTEDK